MDLTGALEKLQAEYNELEQTLAQPEVVADNARFRELSIRFAGLGPTLELYAEYRQALSDRQEAEAMLADAEEEDLREYLTQEAAKAGARAEQRQAQIVQALAPTDPLAQNNAIVEIRGGTGGEEAALFARDLCEMYLRFAERRRWKTEILSTSEAERGGFKEVVFRVQGRGAFGTLALESGVHRVQRVPETESQGRLHTSAATVAVLPEVQAVDVELDPSDLEFEAFRAGGPGGQHMQKNETAVRVTHKPSGLSVTCSSERSQQQNRERALTVLRARLYEQQRRQREQELSAQRREQIGSGDRSEKIRTYNFPQDRVTDHRAGVTVHNLPALLAGDMDELVGAVQAWSDQQRLAEVIEG